MGLYHSARGSVNYSITGSPTIVDGVISNVNNSDSKVYTSNSLPSDFNSFELVEKIKSTYTTFTSVFCLRPTRTSYVLLGGPEGARRTEAILVLNNTRVILLDDLNVFPSSLWPVNDWFYVKLTCVKNNGTYTYKLALSPDKTNWVEGEYQSETNFLASEAISFLYSYVGATGDDTFADLNETYIKVNGQPWFGICPIEVKHINYGTSVGYTKIGSPTISNGIVTYARTANCLSLTKNFELVNNEVEFVTKITGESVIFIGYLSNSKKFQLSINSSGAFYVYINDSPVLGLANAASYGYVRFHKTADGSVTTLQAGNDGVNWTISNTGNNLQYTNFDSNRFCTYADTGKTIDLNHTYIKLNGKLWFYRPCTNYLLKDNKLIWADSGIYVQEPNAADYTVVGSPTINNGVVSNFSENNYLTVDKQPTSPINSLEIIWDFTTGDPMVPGGSYVYSNVMTRKTTAGYTPKSYIYSYRFYVDLYDASNNYQLVQLNNYSDVLSLSTSYSYKLTWDSQTQLATLYKKNGANWDQKVQQSVGSIAWNEDFIIGTGSITENYFTGSINLNNFSITINGETWWSGAGGAGAKNYATQNMAPVPAGYTYGTTSTTAIGYVDIPTQVFTPAPEGSTIGRDE